MDQSGQISHEIMSTYTLQAQGRRSTVALPERIKAHRECLPGAKSRNIAPYARGTKVIGKADRGARQHPGTSMFQKGPPQNLWDHVSTKLLLPRSCPINLQGTPNGSTEGNGCYLDNSPHPIDIESGPSPEDRVRCCIKSIKTMGSRMHNKYSPPGALSIDPPVSEHLIPRNLQVPKDKSTGPIGSEHEALRSLRFQRRIIRDYGFLHDVRRYLRVVRQRIGQHASTKGLVAPEERMRKIAVFTRLLSSTELLHPRVKAYVLQKIILQLISNHRGT
ncbi:hypothetical protein DY000_02040746 [Brassica cretica]|uniref:Uncharacterized protein n=1 Tax=Brassica cretica TaxID=69181 RepID=A0ABQ7BG98_BRACR|nr:hypothetical protein DY000_02040746 [Brassica cretica]